MHNNPLNLSNLPKLSNMKIFHNLPKLDFGGFALLEYLLSHKPTKKVNNVWKIHWMQRSTGNSDISLWD